MHFFFTTPQAPKKRFKAQRAFPTKAEGSGLVASFLPGLRAAGLPRLCRGGEQWRKEADNTTHGCPAHTGAGGGTEEESVVVSCEYPGGRIKARWYWSPDGAWAPPRCCCQVCGNLSGAEILLCLWGSACHPAVLPLIRATGPGHLDWGKQHGGSSPGFSWPLDAAGWLLHSVLWQEKTQTGDRGRNFKIKLISQKMFPHKKNNPGH